QQNGKAKRTIRTINNIIRTLLFQASLPSSFWVEALHMAVHVLNLLPTTTLTYRAPFEVLYGFFPTYSHLRVFGCLCYPNLSATSQHKLAPQSTTCVYLDHFLYSSFHSTPSTSEYDVFGYKDTPLVTPGLAPLHPFANPRDNLSDVSPTPINEDTMHHHGRVVSDHHHPETPTRASSQSDSTSSQTPRRESGGVTLDLSHVKLTIPHVSACTSVSPSLSTHPMVTRSQTSFLRCNLCPYYVLNISLVVL
ncbi:retrotransposon protein, putative, ty1-copia subclass, partial [Tanacetum coccineum]